MKLRKLLVAVLAVFAGLARHNRCHRYPMILMSASENWITD